MKPFVKKMSTFSTHSYDEPTHKPTYTETYTLSYYGIVLSLISMSIGALL